MLKENRLLIVIFVFLLAVDIALVAFRRNYKSPQITATNTWTIESIDTVKYSRDLARQFENDSSYDKTIDSQVKAVADAGANYIAIGTPYDKEFVPFLTRWVKAARKYGLKIWFRGNFSGWENWFEYPLMTRDQHKTMLKAFILDNGSLFEDGDIFTSCTECENGGPGDPRQTGDTEGHRQFLISEYQIARSAFIQIGKNVSANYFPMNYDVAKLIMDGSTTQALGGVVVIDHYVKTPEILGSTIRDLESSSGGKVVLGEFGVPIPDIHGDLTDNQQAEWINKALTLLGEDENIIGVNYWTSFGGSTRLWKDDGSATPAVSVIRGFYKPKVLAGVIQNEAGQYIKGANVASSIKTAKTNANGQFAVTYLPGDAKIKLDVSSSGYESKTVDAISDGKNVIISLKKQNESIIYKFQKFLFKNLGI